MTTHSTAASHPPAPIVDDRQLSPQSRECRGDAPLQSEKERKMLGYRFYLESDSPQQKRRDEHSGNVIAIMLYKNGRGRWEVVRDQAGGELLSFHAVYFHADSAVCSGQVSWDYLRENCRRIPEAMAREIHPAMFTHIAYCEKIERQYREDHPEEAAG